METVVAKGQCLCGAIKITATKMIPIVAACHCNMCRRWGGGPLLATDCGEDIQFDGEEHIGTYDSSEWAQRGFCKQCGTHLFYRLREPVKYFIPVGIFDDMDNVTFEDQVFIDEKPGYYDFSNKTKNLTGEELFALYAPPEK